MARRDELVNRLASRMINGTNENYGGYEEPSYSPYVQPTVNSVYDQLMGGYHDDAYDLAMERAAQRRQDLYTDTLQNLWDTQQNRNDDIGLWKDNSIKTTDERDALLDEYRRIQNANSIPMVQRKNEIRNRLSEIDQELGNGAMSYGTDRVSDTIGGGVKGWAGENASFFGTVGEALSNIGKKLGGNTSDYAGWATDELAAAQIGMENDERKRRQQLAETRQLQETGERWSQSGEADIAKAQNGLGKIGRTAVEMGANMVQMGLDSATAGLMGGSGALVPLFTRAAGGGMQEAKANGATLGQQLAYGGTVGGIEAATEMLFGGLAKIYGKSSADVLVEDIVRKATKSPALQKAMLTLADMGGEAAEEFISDVLNPAAKMIYNGKSASESYKENFSFSDAMHDALIGGLIGGFGAGMKAVSGDYSETTKRMGYTNKAEEALREQWGTEKAGAKAAKEYASLIGREAAGEGLSNTERAKLETKPTAVNVLETIRNDMKADTAAEEHALTGWKKAELQGNLQETLQNGLSQVADVTETEAKALVSSYEAGTADAQTFYTAARAAFAYGANGISEAETVQSMQKAGYTEVTEKQISDAWKMGAMHQEDTVDTRTEEGREALRSQLASLGENAEKAAEVYEPTQSAPQYAKAMQRAAELYAAHGADLTEVAQQAREGLRRDSISYLTDNQLQVAQEIGRTLQQSRTRTIEKQTAKFEEIQQKAAELENPTVKELNQAITEANDYLTTAELELKQATEEMNAMQESGAWSTDEVAFQAASAKVQKLQAAVDGTRAVIGDLEQQRAELKGPGKPGQVTFVTEAGAIPAGKGEPDVEYKAVDQSKLSKTQKAAVSVAEAMARASGLDIRIVDMGNVAGGAYMRGSGGVMYLNIANAETETFKGNITIASMSHELTHWLQEYAPKEYEQLKGFILQEMMKNPGTFETIFDIRSGIYTDLTPDQITDEMVANACQLVLKDEPTIRRLVNQNRSLAEKIRDFILKFIEDVKAAFADIDAGGNLGVMREVRAVEHEMDTIRELWVNAFKTASENLQAENVASEATKNAACEGDVQYQRNTSKDDTIRKQVVKASDRLNGMPVAATVNVSNVPKDVSRAVQWAVERLKHTGFKVDRMNFGTIIFDETHIREALRHITNHPDEIGAILALPRVLKRGVIIEQHEDHKNRRGPDSFTIAAPVVVNGVRGNMAIIVQRTTKNFYHAHRVLLPNNANFTFEYNKKADSKRTGELPGNRALIAESVETASADSIAKMLDEVNTEDPVALQEVAEASGAQFSRFVEDEDTLKFLNDQEKAGKVVRTYKSFLEIDGKLYPPMASMQKDANGKYKMSHAMEVGRWEESVGDPSKVVIDPKNGKGYYVLKKDNGDTVKAAYNPYQHSSNLMLNDQFTGAYARPNLVTYECIIPESELTSGYRAEYAKDAVGVHSWKAGPVAGKLVKAKGTERQVYLSRWLKPVRKVPDAEVAQHYKELLDGTDIAVPSNVVPPSLLKALEEAGVNIEYDARAPRTQLQILDTGAGAVEVDQETDSVNPQFSLLTWEESDYVAERDKAADEIAKAIGVSKKKALDYIDSVNSVAKMIAENKGRLDYADTGRSPFVGNTEYGGSFDFTTLCKKRRLLTGTFSAIQQALPNTALTANEILQIRKMMDDAGLEVSCGKCYVEGSRASMGTFTKEFLELYKKYNPGKWVPNMAQMNTPDGIEWVRQTHPEVCEQYEYFWNHYGTLKPGDPNLFASQQKPKLYQMRSAYKGEVLRHFRNDGSIEEKNRNGGMRMQSFSDFEIVHLIDAMQVIMDMSRVGLNGQAYTKVPDFAWALGKTGLKINLSIDAWSVDENGKLVFNNKEGMNFDEAMRIRDANSENVGTICCVYDDTQLLAALADDRIDFIIPFHRSQWKKSQYKAMGLPATTKDYTYQQNEKWLNPKAHTHEYRGRQVPDRCTNYMPNTYWDYSKSGKENAEAYLKMCAKDGKRPKFYRFLTNNGDGSFSLKEDGSTDGYWKLLIDFKMYDNKGRGVPQRPVQPNFNMREIGRMLAGYEGGHNQFPVAQGIVDEFVQNYKDSHPGQTQFQRYGEIEGQEEFDDVTRNGMNPEMRRKIEMAENLTRDVKAFFDDLNPNSEAWLSEDDIDDIFYADPYGDPVNGYASGSEDILDRLDIVAGSRPGRERTKIYELMERIVQLSGNTVQSRIEGSDTKFAKWYNKRHPSLYYPGYKQGDMFGQSATASDNRQKERDYLHELLNREDIAPVTRREARELLEELMGPDSSTLYQRWDDVFDDTESEREGRSLAYSRLQSENAILNDALKSLEALTKKQENTIGKLQQRLKLTKTPEVRESDAKKLAGKYLRDSGSRADRAEIAAELKAIGDYMLNGKVDAEELKARARSLAGKILDKAESVMESDNETLQHIRSTVEGQKVYLSSEFLGELDGEGGLQSVKNRLFGKRLYLSGEAGDGRISVDRLYEDLHAQYGDYYFPEAGSENGPSNAGEEILIIADVLDAAGGITVNPFEQYMGEAVESLANDIVNDALQGIMRPVQTDADKWKSVKTGLNDRIKELKKEQALSDKEATRLWETVYDLSMALDKANSRYQTLQAEADYRTAQARAEGTARAAEIRARERERAETRVRGLKEHYQEMTEKARNRREENAGVTKYRKQVQKKTAQLYELLMTNSDKKHVPEVLKRPLAEFLESIDFTSKRQLRGGEETNADKEFGRRLRELERVLNNQQRYISGDKKLTEKETEAQSGLGGYVDISEENLEYLRTVVEMIDTALKENRDFTVNQMGAAELKQLSNFLSNLGTAIRTMNYFMANARFETVREAAAGDYEYMKKLGKASPFARGNAVRFVGWQNGTPYYVFKRFGEGGKSIFDGFAKGWERMAFNANDIIEFTKDLYSTKEVNSWKKTIHDITLSDGSKIQMTTAQIMELSMLLNREQALKHIEKGGIRIGDIETGKGPIQDITHYHLTMDDILKITGLLDARQRKVAKALQSYMARKGAEWGNEISMRRFGYEFYAEGENYYPIRTDSNDRPMADTDAQMNSMFRLLNLSSSKSLNPKASNALIVGDIFDTFSEHMADMAKLNGMGLPVLDAIKWFNYKERINNEDGTYDTQTIQSAMEQAFGSEAQRYFRTLVKDINGMTESGDRGTNIIGKMMSNYKIASVGANLRVAFLQPTSYARAMTVLKPQFLIGNLPSVAAYREALKYSGTAMWKALGYYDTDINKSMRGQIVHNDTFRDKFAEASMTLAEKGDQLTWSMLWTACKKQAAAENKGLKGEALMEKAADLFREVVYSSQVMDSTLTRSEIMRGKTQMTKMVSAFMAEPTLSYNILLDAVSQYELDVREKGKAGAWQRNAGKIGKAMTVYVASAAFSALVESIADAIRDDDDEEFWKKFKQALWGEDGKWMQGNLAQDLTILGKLPYIKNFVSTLQGYNSGDMSLTAFNNLFNAYKIWEETIKLATGKQDKATKITYYGRMTEWGKVYKTLQALSQLSGFAVSSLTRDVTAIWNTIMNDRKNDWKIRTYDSNALSEKQQAGFDEYIKPMGFGKSQYKAILNEANSDGTGSVTQAEMDAYLQAELEAGNLTAEQAAGIWDAQGWKKTYDEYRAKASKTEEPKGTTKTTAKAAVKTTTQKSAATPKPEEPKTIDNYDSFSKAAPLYGKEKKAASYNVWANYLAQTMSLDRFTQILDAADTDRNGSLKQNELGWGLVNAVKNREMSQEVASMIWDAQGWSHNFNYWLNRNYA